jgi:hypothetical protein
MCLQWDRLLEDTEDDVSFNVLLILTSIEDHFLSSMAISRSLFIINCIWIFQFNGCLVLLQLAELIKKGSVKVGGVSKVLCQDLSKHCSQTR